MLQIQYSFRQSHGLLNNTQNQFNLPVCLAPGPRWLLLLKLWEKQLEEKRRLPNSYRGTAFACEPRCTSPGPGTERRRTASPDLLEELGTCRRGKSRGTGRRWEPLCDKLLRRRPSCFDKWFCLLWTAVLFESITWRQKLQCNEYTFTVISQDSWTRLECSTNRWKDPTEWSSTLPFFPRTHEGDKSLSQ